MIPATATVPHTEQWQRGNGRLYRMQYQGFQPANVDLSNLTDSQLVEAQLHKNEWHVRMARLVLSERAAERRIDAAAANQLRDMVLSKELSAARRLRALWCLHAIDRLDIDVAKSTLVDESEYVRAWTIQLLAETEELAGREPLILNALREESSAFVKLYLVSAASRLSDRAGWTILETLASDGKIAKERSLRCYFGTRWLNCYQTMLLGPTG